MAKILAKFQCWSIKNISEDSSTDRVVNLFPVLSGSEENKSFSKYTPAGQLVLQVNPETEAFDYFEVGKEYYLTIEDCDEVKE